MQIVYIFFLSFLIQKMANFYECVKYNHVFLFNINTPSFNFIFKCIQFRGLVKLTSLKKRNYTNI